MAIRRKIDPPAAEPVNLTPLIDCTFQLIIFFILVNDMSQRELEVLTLPRAPSVAVEDRGEDKSRLVVNIVDLLNPEVQKDAHLDPKKTPLVVNGRQMATLDEMRAWLRRAADPVRFPDLTRPLVDERRKIYPSRKPLLIRCDQHQVFGWVQAVMQACSIMPGRDLDEELAQSPLIWRIEIAARKKEQPR